ncbi:uncharacterized protein LOC143646204 [Tamandua tetradactyla]|uniref:uncharacterized protein LOC143646204 n=1 Tax=Tamandua tetradactyla TaxID=48850 RepID=UPI004054861B
MKDYYLKTRWKFMFSCISQELSCLTVGGLSSFTFGLQRCSSHCHFPAVEGERKDPDKWFHLSANDQGRAVIEMQPEVPVGCEQIGHAKSILFRYSMMKRSRSDSSGEKNKSHNDMKRGGCKTFQNRREIDVNYMSIGISYLFYV